jgi:hypothetical protein
MSACETCWARASAEAAHLGGSVAELYHVEVNRQDALGRNATCPEAQANYRRRAADHDNECEADFVSGAYGYTPCACAMRREQPARPTEGQR